MWYCHSNDSTTSKKLTITSRNVCLKSETKLYLREGNISHTAIKYLSDENQTVSK